jgi:hypothetical protein
MHNEAVKLMVYVQCIKRELAKKIEGPLGGLIRKLVLTFVFLADTKGTFIR